MTPDRQNKLENVALRRQTDLTVVLENVHDPHNVSAVLRSCDAVGIHEIYLLYTDERIRLLEDEMLNLGIKSSAGARRWVDVWYYDDVNACFADVKKRYAHVLGTHLGAESKPLYEVDLSQSTAIVLGNEHEGLTAEALGHCTGNIIIPLQGMVQSLNISVACAVSLFEAMRQRMNTNAYLPKPESPANRLIAETYKLRHQNKLSNKRVKFGKGR